jgi:glycosyltransferase involved in cell wall biosynthesis
MMADPVKNVHVCFCIKAMNNAGGGAERVLATVASGLVERGYDVSLVTFDRPSGTSFFPLSPMIRRLELGIGPTNGPATLWLTVRRIAALRRCMRSLAPHVTIGFMHSMFIPLGFALWGTGTAVVASEHIVPSHYETRPLQALLLRLTPYLATRITCVSEQVRQLYPRSLRDKMIVVENPLMAVRGRANVIGDPGARRTLLSVGRLDAQKDHATLIDAFAGIASEVPDWDLSIVGDGPLRSELEAKISALGMNSRIRMPGVFADIGAQYTRAQLFVQPSRYESLGLTTAEALVHGLPAVGFADCTGTNCLIQDSVTGELVSGDVPRAAALARTLSKLMRDSKRRVFYAGNIVESNVRDLDCKVLDDWERIILKEAYGV